MKTNKRTNNDLQTEGQTMQWLNEKEQKDKQRSTNRRTDNAMVK